MLLSIGDQVRPGRYRLHSCFAQAANFERAGRLVSVVDESIGPGPLNIVLRGLREMARSCARYALKDRRSDTAGSSPSPRPSPTGRGRSMARVATFSELARGGQHGRWFTLSPGERAGVRGNTSSPTYPRPNTASNPPLAPWSLVVGRGWVQIPGHRFPFTSRQRYDSTLQLRAVDPQRFQENLAALADALKADAPPKSLAFLLAPRRRKHLRTAFDRAFADQITRGVDQILQGHWLEGVAELKGCGRGLTPAGDDFIAGFLIGLHVLRKTHGRKLLPVIEAVSRAARGSNVFANTFLDLARRGLLFGCLKDLLQALTAGRRPAVRKAAVALFTLGETSGADLATGLFLTLVSEVTCPASAKDL